MDLTVANPCVPTILDKHTEGPGNLTIELVKRKHNKYRGAFAAIYTLLSLAMSVCGTLDSNTQTLIKVMADRHVEIQSDKPIGWERAEAAGILSVHRAPSLPARGAIYESYPTACGVNGSESPI